MKNWSWESAVSEHRESLERFLDIVRLRRRDRTMVALIVDSPWLPGYAGVRTLDFYFDDETWLEAHRRLLRDLPGVAFIPGAWVEFGMAAEPSAWGAGIRWSDREPPSILRSSASLAELGIPPRMAAARGPLAVAANVHGLTQFLMAVKLEPEGAGRFLDRTTDLCIRWLRAQLQRMEDPVGVLVLDDVVGMLSPKDAETFAFGRLERIFREFAGLVRIFHDDAPNAAVYPGLARVGVDVFNFSHATDLRRARELLGPDVVLMGNVPPLEVLVRGSPEEVREATLRELELLEDVGPLVISAGGGVSPGTPIENLQAMASAVAEREE